MENDTRRAGGRWSNRSRVSDRARSLGALRHWPSGAEFRFGRVLVATGLALAVPGCGPGETSAAKTKTYELPPQGQLAPLFGDGEGPGVVVSLAFDDGFATQSVFFDVLDEVGADDIRGSFYVNSSRLNLEGTERDPRDLERYAPLDVWIRAAQDGHEIGSHSATHRDLSCTTDLYDQGLCQPGHVPIDSADLHREICGDRELLRALGFDVTGFAYPFGRGTSGESNDNNVADVVEACGFDYGRGTNGLARGAGGDSELPLAEAFPPRDRYYVRSYESLSEDVGFEAIKGWIMDARAAGGGWVPLLMHHVSDDCVDPEDGAATLGVCTRRDELEALVRWLTDDAPSDVETRTIGQVMAEVGSIEYLEVANGDLEDPHGGSVERPLCFDRLEGMHEENFEWSSADWEAERLEQGEWGDPDGASGRFEKLIPTESHPTPLVRMTTMDDGCYLAVHAGKTVQVRLRARARTIERGEVLGQFVIETLSVPVVDGQVTPTWSEWVTASGASQPLTEEWQTQHLNLPPIPEGVVALSVGYQYVAPEPEGGEASEIWVDDFELLEFP